MKVNFIELFSTPLDIGHSKVIDIVGDNLTEEQIKTIYKETLERDYVKEVVASNLVRSVKMIGKRCELVIFKNYLDLQKYNYILINDLYFFIESVTSNNDSDTNPSSSLTLVWDYWANNLHNFINDNSYVNIKNRHIDRFILGDKNKPLFYSNDTGEIKHTEKEISYIQYLPLYLKLILNPSVYRDYQGGKQFIFDTRFKCTFDGVYYDVENTYAGVHTGDRTSSADIIYLPLGIFDTINRNFVSGYIHTYFNKTFSTGKNVSVNEYYETQFNEDNISFSLNSIVTEKSIWSAELTFYSPIDYNISTYNDKPSLEYNIPTLISSSIGGILYNTSFTVSFLPDIPILAVPQTINLYDGGTPSSTIAIGLNNDDIPIKLSNEYIIGYNDYITNNIVTSIRFTDNMADPKFMQFPYNYIKLSYKDGDIILSPMSKNNNDFAIEIINNTNQPSLKIKLLDYNDNAEYLFDGQLFLNNSGFLAYTENALASYQARYGNQLSTDLTINGLIKPISSIILNAPKDILGGGLGMGMGLLRDIETFIDVGSTYAQFDAKIKDLSNTPDKLINSILSEYDIIEQDRVRLYHCKCTNLQTVETHRREFYNHGYEINSLGNPFNNYRVWFDFVSCNSCKLNLSINNEDRIELENMFNRGVHKFHIHAEDTTIFKSSLSLNPTGYNNIEISVWKGEQ